MVPEGAQARDRAPAPVPASCQTTPGSGFRGGRYLPHEVVVLAQVHMLGGDDPARERPHLGASLDPGLGEDAEPFPGDGALGDYHFRRQHQAGELLHLCEGGDGSERDRGGGEGGDRGQRGPLPTPAPAQTPGLSLLNAQPGSHKAVQGSPGALRRYLGKASRAGRGSGAGKGG